MHSFYTAGSEVVLTEPVGGRGDSGAPGTGLSTHSGTGSTTALNWSPEMMETGRKSSPRVTKFPIFHSKESTDSGERRTLRHVRQGGRHLGRESAVLRGLAEKVSHPEPVE